VSESTTKEKMGTIWKKLKDCDDNGIVVGNTKQRTLLNMQCRGRG